MIDLGDFRLSHEIDERHRSARTPAPATADSSQGRSHGADGIWLELATRTSWSLAELTLAWMLVLVAYGFQGTVPAFNADDVMQMQNPHDVHAILVQGRWGYAWTFGVLQGSSYAPLLSTAVGALLLCATAAIAASVLGLERAVARFAFVVVASVSAYYGELFSYDSTRVAVPLGNLAAVLGLACAIRGRRGVGIAVMALAPAFYPAASELAATVLVAYALQRCAGADERGPRAALVPALCLLLSLVLYAVGTRVVYDALGIELDTARTRLDLLATLRRLPEIGQLLTVHSLPVLAPRDGWYLPGAAAIAASVLGIAYLVTALLGGWQRWGTRGVAVAALLAAALPVTPYALLFVSGGGNTQFVPRALYGLAMVHAVWGASLLDRCCGAVRRSRAARAAALVVAALLALLVLGNALAIGQRALDDYLASQSDLLATNRIIARIEGVLAETPGAPTAEIPLAVIYDRPTVAGPRGDIGTARSAPWSREWIFHLVDRRFSWVSGEPYRRCWEAAQSHGEWPARDAVFLHDGIVVVVVTKGRGGPSP